MKKCSKCKIEKELEEFSKDKYRPDGFNIYCKLCHNENGKISNNKNKENARTNIDFIIS